MLRYLFETSIAFFLFITVTIDLYGDDTDYFFKQIAVEQGLSQSTVRSVLCDRKGIMWIGTSSGLNSFDRYKLNSFVYEKNNPGSIPGNSITFVAEDLFSNIWVATNQGLVRYDHVNGRFVAPVDDGKLMIFSYYPDTDGMLFGGTGALHKYVYREKNIVNVPLNISSEKRNIQFNKILSLGNDSLLIVSKLNGMWIYDMKTADFTKFDCGYEHELCIAGCVDTKKRIWMSSYRNGLFCYDKNGKEIHRLTSKNSGLSNDIVLDILEKDGKLWIATDGGGINILDVDDLSFTVLKHIPGDPGSLPVNSINKLYNDNQNNLWAGSVRGGMFGIKAVSMKTFGDVPLNNENGLSEKSVISLYEDGDKILWIGTDGGGINSYNPVTGKFKHYTGTYGEKISSITDFSENELLLSFFSNGVYLFDKKTGNYKPFTIVNDEINRLECVTGFSELVHRVSDDEIYFLSRNAYIYSVKNKKFAPIRAREEDRRYLPALKLFFSDNASSSSYLFNENRVFEIPHGSDSLIYLFACGEQETIISACRDAKDNIWIGTDYGLSRYDPRTETLKQIETGLFNSVSSLYSDELGRLWIGAQNRLFTYLIYDDKFIHWGNSDGFLTNELLFYYSTAFKTNNIYMGGVNGLVKINKFLNFDPNVQVRIILADLLVDGNSLSNKLMDYNNMITVPWNYNSIELKVISIEKDVFRNPLFRYSVTKNNTDEQIIESYSHLLNLQRLNPGNYTVTVSCSTKNGQWSAPVKALSFEVKLPWFKTVWFMLLTGITAGLIIVVTVVGIIRKKERKLQQELKEHRQKSYEDMIDFFVNISHELRTPLTLIYTPLKRLLDNGFEEFSPQSDSMHEQLSAILKQAHQMRNILNMMLDISKINARQYTVNLRLHSLNKWIVSVAENFEKEFEATNMHLKYDLDENIGNIPFDKSKCETVLSNLLMNALKFGASGPEVTVSSRLNGDRVRISVSDSGIGLSNVNTYKLFSRFHQGSHNFTGTGIGLSYSKMLVEMHGGLIGAINNDEGKGATFFFELPLKAHDNIQREVAPAGGGDEISGMNTEKPDESIFSTRSRSLLIVEDTEELSAFMKKTFTDYFNRIYVAENGIRALSVSREKQPDIIVSDVLMPEMDGYEFCKRLKEDITISHIPVILLTAKGDEESVYMGYKSGADAYLSKPFDVNFLLTLIRNQLRNAENLKARYKRDSSLLSPQEATISNADEKFMLKLDNLIYKHLSEASLDVKFFASEMAVSRASLYNKVKILTGMGVKDYINRIRIDKAGNLLINTDMTISEISDTVGFAYQRYFSTVFKQLKGDTPSAFRQKHAKSFEISE